MNAPAGRFSGVEQETVAFLGTGPVPATPCYDPEWYEAERQAMRITRAVADF